MKATLALLFLAPLTSFAQDFGPIQTRNHRALSLPFLRMRPLSAPLNRGERAWGVDFAVANDFRLLTEAGRTVEEDHETARFGAFYRWGLQNGDELLIELPLLARGGGFLDPIIDGWHQDVLGWSDPRRDDTAFGRSEISAPGAGFDSASGLGDLSLTLSRGLSSSLVASAAVKLPTGDPDSLLGSGGLDLGLSFTARYALAPRWTLYGQLGAVWQGKGSALRGERQFVHQEGLFLVYRNSARDAWSVQWQGEASATETGVSGSDATHRLITFGWQRFIGGGQLLQLYFSEDRDLFNGKWPEGANVGPDFTAGINWQVRF